MTTLARVKEQMAEGGVIAIAHQPRKPGATDADAEEAAKNITTRLEEAGFKNITLKKRVMKPVSTVCVLGVNA